MAPPAIVETPIDALLAHPQVRQHFEESALAGLAQSIREVGLLQPILARRHEGRLVIVDGDRRHRAAKIAGLTSVPVIIDERSWEACDLWQAQLVANWQREDLTPIEKARAVAKLMKNSGCSASDAAGKLGVSPAAVTRALALLALPPDIRELVNAGRIPTSAACDLARVKDSQQQAELARRLAEGHLTRDGLSGAVRRRSPATPANKRPLLKRAVVALSSTRSVTLVDEALDLDRLITSLEEALGKARKARTQGIELATFCRMLKDQAKQ